MTAGGASPLAGKRVWVAGADGLVGSALVRRLVREGCHLLTVPRSHLDLRRQADTEAWVGRHRPQVVVVAAATVGGILANSTRPAEFIYDNLAIVANVVHAAHLGGVGKLMVLGSSCFYPRLAAQPIAEDSLLTGAIEPTNEWYAVAKIAGIKLAQAYRRQYGRDFIAAVPTNLYGPGDNFDPDTGHVVPAMIRKVDAARRNGGPVDIWGTGTPRREFLHVDDAADALVFLLETYSAEDPVNVAAGEDVSILELAQRVARVVGYDGEFRCDPSKPDGMPRKQLDASRLLAMGWRPRIPLDQGLAQTYAWYRAEVAP